MATDATDGYDQRLYGIGHIEVVVSPTNLGNTDMRSVELHLDQYDSDKIASGYLRHYDGLLAPWIDRPVALLELGIHRGGSLALWRDYFPRGSIVGIDLRLPASFHPGERIQMFQGSQDDTEFLSSVASRTAPSGFDIIIDDASHLGALTKVAFWHLFDNHLKPGGLYAIEDWGTGYWDDWPDGRRYRPPAQATQRSLWRRLLRGTRLDGVGRKTPFPCHSYGMVGIVKELVDEQAAADIARGGWRPVPCAARSSKFQEIVITPSIVFIRKAGAATGTAPPSL